MPENEKGNYKYEETTFRQPFSDDMRQHLHSPERKRSGDLHLTAV